MKAGDNCSTKKLPKRIPFLDKVRMQKWEGGRNRNEHDFTQRCDLRTELRHDWDIKRPWLVRNFGHLRKDVADVESKAYTHLPKCSGNDLQKGNTDYLA